MDLLEDTDWQVDITLEQIESADADEAQRFLSSVLADLDETSATTALSSLTPLQPIDYVLESAGHSALNPIQPLIIPSSQVSESTAESSKNQKKNYRCRNCGQLRKGHTCVSPTERSKRCKAKGTEQQRAGFFIQLVLLWWNRIRGMTCTGRT